MPDAAAAGPAIGEILGREFFGVKLGLEPMRRLCAGLNHPERAYATIIVAGTNGKGSVAAIAAHALSEAGYRTGRYTSPHLVSIAERFVVAGAPLPPDALEDAASSVLAAEARGLAGGGITLPMTFFELGTATAFEAFRRAGVEVAVVEVGLGGRLDATNVVSPVAAAITSIDFDHQQHLGDTLAAIAREKAGVARPGVPLVTGPMRAEPLEAIRAVASEIGAPLIDAASTIQTQWQMGADGQQILGRFGVHEDTIAARVSDPPRFLLFSTKITNDLSIETNFIRKWFEVARQDAGIGPGKQKGVSAKIANGRTFQMLLEVYFSGMWRLIDDNLRVLDEMTLYVDDEHWRLEHPGESALVNEVVYLDRNTPWDGRLRETVEALRRYRSGAVQSGDERLALRMLEKDVTWLTKPSFAQLVERWWLKGIENEWKSDRPKMTQSVQHWFRLRTKRAPRIVDSAKDRALRAAIFELAVNPTDSRENLAMNTAVSDYGLDDVKPKSIERYLRGLDLRPETTRLRIFTKFLFGQAMMRTAIRTPSKTQDRSRSGDLRAAKRQAGRNKRSE